MSARIPPEFIDAVLARTDLVELIQRRIPLRKAGKNYQARCPFHEEKTPSFTVNREKQFFHCFGCGAHGSAIGFLMDYEHRDFLDVLEELASAAGMEMPQRTENGPDLKPLYHLMDRAAALFRTQLEQNARAREYLRKRGLKQSDRQTFSIGYAPPRWDFLLRALGRDASMQRQLATCGLLVDQDGRRYDRFRDRILFPIRDTRGRVIGFGGRVLGEGQPKYLNSPETPLFHKGRELYGLYEARQRSRTLRRVLVVEGYLDVIALARAGIESPVATLGTALTPDHLRTLCASASEILFCFDGDAAGRRAARKALTTALPLASGSATMRFLFLPEGDDPDSLLQKKGRDAFERYIRNAIPLSEYLFQILQDQIDLGTLEGRNRLAHRARPLIARVPPGVFRDLLEGRLDELVGVSGTLPEMPPRPRVPPPATDGSKPIRSAIALILQCPDLVTSLDGLPEDWRSLKRLGIPTLGELLDQVREHPRITPAALLERWRGREAYPHLQRLSDPRLFSESPPEGLAAELRGYLAHLNREADRQRFRALSRKSLDDLTEEERRFLREYRGTCASGG